MASMAESVQQRIARLRRRKNRFVERLRDRIEERKESTATRIERLKRQAEHQQEPQAFHMYDSIVVGNIPLSAVAVAGYVNGWWPTYSTVVSKWPRAKHLSIAVTSSANADCLDVEPGDATPADAPAWVRRQKDRGVKRPAVYTSLSQAQGLVQTLANAGIKREDYRLWTAHYNYSAHRCTPACGFGLKTTADATQFTNNAGGHPDGLDESLCAPDFL